MSLLAIQPTVHSGGVSRVELCEPSRDWVVSHMLDLKGRLPLPEDRQQRTVGREKGEGDEGAKCRPGWGVGRQAAGRSSSPPYGPRRPALPGPWAGSSGRVGAREPALPGPWAGRAGRVGGQGGSTYRTGWRIIPFLVTNVIIYVILANTMAIR